MEVWVNLLFLLPYGGWAWPCILTEPRLGRVYDGEHLGLGSQGTEGNVRLFPAAFRGHGSGDERAGLVPCRPCAGDVGRHDRKELRASAAENCPCSLGNVRNLESIEELTACDVLTGLRNAAWFAYT